MKKRFLPHVAAALLLGPLLVASPGCAKPDAGPPPKATVVAQTNPYCDRPDGMAVTVYVRWDGTSKKATTSTKTAYVCRDKDWVEWVSSDGDLQDPAFAGGSPFDDKPRHDGKVLKSGKAKRKGKFDYQIDLKVGTDVIKVDPRIEVME